MAANRFPAVWVEWVDHADPSKDDKVWHDLDALDTEPAVIHTIAFLIKETRDAYLVAHSYGASDAEDEEQQGAGPLLIAKSAVKKFKKVKI